MDGTSIMQGGMVAKSGTKERIEEWGEFDLFGIGGGLLETNGGRKAVVVVVGWGWCCAEECCARQKKKNLHKISMMTDDHDYRD